MNWYSDESAFNSENKIKIGGKIAALPGLQQAFKMTNTPTTVLDWNEFRRVYRKWHKRLTAVRYPDFLERSIIEPFFPELH